MKLKTGKIQVIARKLFKEILPKDKLVKVDVKEREDWYREEVLRVMIVYSGQQLHGEGTLMLGTLAHGELAKADEERCPVFGFVVKEKAWEMGIEIP